MYLDCLNNYCSVVFKCSVHVWILSASELFPGLHRHCFYSHSNFTVTLELLEFSLLDLEYKHAQPLSYTLVRIVHSLCWGAGDSWFYLTTTLAH